MGCNVSPECSARASLGRGLARSRPTHLRPENLVRVGNLEDPRRTSPPREALHCAGPVDRCTAPGAARRVGDSTEPEPDGLNNDPIHVTLSSHGCFEKVDRSGLAQQKAGTGHQSSEFRLNERISERSKPKMDLPTASGLGVTWLDLSTLRQQVSTYRSPPRQKSASVRFQAPRP